VDIRELAKRTYEANMELALEELRKDDGNDEVVEKCLAAAVEIAISFQEIFDQEVRNA